MSVEHDNSSSVQHKSEDLEHGYKLKGDILWWAILIYLDLPIVCLYMG